MLFIRSLLFNTLFYGLTAAMSILGLPLLALPKRLTMAYARIWGRLMSALLGIVGITHRVDGRRPGGPVIYAAKHQSAWETIALYDELGCPAPVLKRSLLLYPLIGLYFVKVPSIPIDRSSGARALRRLGRRVARIAAEGHSILIFPQGTRVAPGRSAPYLPGTYAIYRASGLEVVPVALNSGTVWGRGSFTKRPGEIVVRLLPPIPPGLDRGAFMARLEQAVETASDALPGMAEAAERG